jgi:hypothetical protein
MLQRRPPRLIATASASLSDGHRRQRDCSQPANHDQRRHCASGYSGLLFERVGTHSKSLPLLINVLNCVVVFRLCQPTIWPSHAQNTEAMKRLVTSLESRGCKVLFYELPQPANLENSHYAQTAQSLVRTAFPNPKQWPSIDYHRSELRWLDNSHMDERSAIIAARAIGETLKLHE